jgi:cbb3-type cytochrome oxidase maturation protein
MSALYMLVPLALLMGTGSVMAFLWAIGRGEFDDLETPALRVLIEDDE